METSCVPVSRPVREHEAVGAGRFGLGDREDVRSRNYRERCRVRPWKRLDESGSTVDPSQSARAFVLPIRRRLIRLKPPRTPRRRRVIRMSPSSRSDKIAYWDRFPRVEPRTGRLPTGVQGRIIGPTRNLTDGFLSLKTLRVRISGGPVIDVSIEVRIPPAKPNPIFTQPTPRHRILDPVKCEIQPRRPVVLQPRVFEPVPVRQRRFTRHIAKGAVHDMIDQRAGVVNEVADGAQPVLQVPRHRAAGGLPRQEQNVKRGRS